MQMVVFDDKTLTTELLETQGLPKAAQFYGNVEQYFQNPNRNLEWPFFHYFFTIFHYYLAFFTTYGTAKSNFHHLCEHRVFAKNWGP